MVRIGVASVNNYGARNGHDHKVDTIYIGINTGLKHAFVLKMGHDPTVNAVYTGINKG